MRLQSPDWWKDYIVSVPRPIPPGMMVGMREEIRDGKLYIVEFLEKVPEYQPSPFALEEPSALQRGRDRELKEK